MLSYSGPNLKGTCHFYKRLTCHSDMLKVLFDGCLGAKTPIDRKMKGHFFIDSAHFSSESQLSGSIKVYETSLNLSEESQVETRGHFAQLCFSACLSWRSVEVSATGPSPIKTSDVTMTDCKNNRYPLKHWRLLQVSPAFVFYIIK